MTKTVVISTRLEPELMERLEAYVDASPGGMAEHVRLAIDNYLNQRETLAARVERLEELVGKEKTMRYRAQERVDRTPELQAHEDVIMYDWHEGDEHWQWVAGAHIKDIVDWVESIADSVSVAQVRTEAY